MGSNADD